MPACVTPSPQSAAAYLLFTEASRQQAAVWDAGLDGLRREMLARLEPAVSLQADLQQLVTIEAGLQAQGAALAERVAQLEEQAARWGVVARLPDGGRGDQQPGDLPTTSKQGCRKKCKHAAALLCHRHSQCHQQPKLWQPNLWQPRLCCPTNPTEPTHPPTHPLAARLLAHCSLQEQVDQQGAEAAQAIRNQVTRAANTQFEEHLAHFEAERLQPLVEAALERQVQQVGCRGGGEGCVYV